MGVIKHSGCRDKGTEIELSISVHSVHSVFGSIQKSEDIAELVSVVYIRDSGTK